MGFTRNYTDQSTDAGFQFEFYCDQCGTAYQTRFAKANSNALPDMLDAAGSLLGGVFAVADQISDRARQGNWQKERDAAFVKACDEVSAKFNQCPACSAWVDKACWNNKTEKCRECAQSEQDEAQYAEEESHELITCGACEAEVKKAKFCSECGKALVKTCTACGIEVAGKFCPECGKKLGGGKKK